MPTIAARRPRAAFIDRDGVVNELVPDPISGRPESPLRAEDVSLVPGASSGLRELARAGWLLVGVSNQPAAAKGVVSRQQLCAVNLRVIELLAREGVQFDDFRVCLHHPDGVVPELTLVCSCRKPAPGMLLNAARENGIDLSGSWMIGDTDGDVRAGRAAGCRTVLIEHEPSSHKRLGDARPDGIAPNLEAAAGLLLGRRE
jgi:D-glycero-D-manno-heptose 1,7-bisphosphate phosphatase